MVLNIFQQSNAITIYVLPIYEYKIFKRDCPDCESYQAFAKAKEQAYAEVNEHDILTIIDTIDCPCV